MTDQTTQESSARPDEEAFEEGPGRDAAPPGPHVARADPIFRLKRYAIVALLVGFGLWSIWDGFFAWPKEAEEYRRLDTLIEQTPQSDPEYARLVEQQRHVEDHSGSDIMLNQLLGVVLPPLGLILLARWLYISRGEIRLDESDTLHVPGRQPIPLSAVKGLDDSRWERKGISFVEFEVPGGDAGRARLDHDWYQPKPIHAIHGRLSYLLSQRPGGSEARMGD